MAEVNPLEQLLKDNWQSIKNCSTPMDQVMLSVDMVYQQELKNCGNINQNFLKKNFSKNQKSLFLIFFSLLLQ